MVEDDDSLLFFFFQAEDGIRDLTVTGVQTCALPICPQTHARTMMTLKLSPSLRQNVLAPGAKQIAINRRTTKRGNCCAGGTLSGGQVTGGRSPPAGVWGVPSSLPSPSLAAAGGMHWELLYSVHPPIIIYIIKNEEH